MLTESRVDSVTSAYFDIITSLHTSWRVCVQKLNVHILYKLYRQVVRLRKGRGWTWPLRHRHINENNT